MINHAKIFTISKVYKIILVQHPKVNLKSSNSLPELPTEIDTVIIGSGFLGTSTAYYLLKGNHRINQG